MILPLLVLFSGLLLTDDAPPSTTVRLEADGLGKTYELIRSVLAPGEEPIETPDQNHAGFGPHITETLC